MTISSETSRASFSGNGSTTLFAFPYYFLADADLIVIERAADGTETTKTITTHYTVSGEGVTAGGSVTMGTAPASGVTLIIYRDPAPTQGLDLVENDSMPAESVEEALDKSTMVSQRLKNRVDRAVRLSEGFVDTFDPTLPLVLTAEKVLRVNDAGTGLELGPTNTALVDAQTAAEAAQAAAEVAQAAAETAETNAETAETNAETAETNAETAETNAAASEAAAALSETAAGTSETNAGTSETNAGNSETAAALSETNAGNSETAAALSETNAGTSETNAGTSETNAAASAVSAAAFAHTVQADTVDAGETIDLAGNGRVTSFITGTGGADAMSVTPFGVTVGNFVDGQQIKLVGVDDTNYPTLTDEDSQYGARLNGDISLTKGVVIKFIYSATLERFYEEYRNN